MLIKLIYYIGIILGGNSVIEAKYFIIIATDCYLKKIIGENDAESKNDIELIYGYMNKLSGEVLWDKYFKRPFFYKINLKDLNKSKNNISLNIKCISNKKEEIYSLEVDRNLQKITISNFSGPNNSKLTP